MRKPLIVGNWKMNKTASEASACVRELVAHLSTSPRVDVVIAPPFTALAAVRETLGPSSGIGLGAQNLHWEPQGAFTGEISGPMLRDLGCTHVLIGHSERRSLFGERNPDIHKKVQAALAHGLQPILCVGESLQQRENGQTHNVITEQLQSGLDQLTAGDLTSVIVAYEPVWAIGTGKAATVEQAVEVHAVIRTFIGQRWGKDAAETIRILYGGSVTPHNAGALLSAEGIDGALVGGACLVVNSFATIIRAAVH
ncbi:Triosephosphate isomerase [Nitrospira sp. KM1]|uniref:triose-phosphate isomerase n=1 Tax=Nitrospira sp. KM1 TaxID=1936990 RepID=UPI0013A7142A|nr:triose-phosphate isomerase [Nitrospira sp. KM1]BCA56232.1 Triosephosphate isomerase [Nitrospira sp. KM1]